jgi:putative flavoprotein involved in K+ transport
VLEAAQPGGSWSERWDSFTLVGPNHTVRLPGATYAGDEPGGFMSGTAVTEHLRDYATRLPAELRTGTPVRRLTPARGGYRLDTDDGAVRARQVVVATGAFQRPLRLPALAGLDPSVAVVDVAGYRNPAALPEGAVLVVGSGQSACQIAEELVLAGRRVVMACGRAPWSPRRVGGRDLFEWLIAAGFYEQTPGDVPPAARHRANVQATGSRGGHDLHYRTLHALGVELAGHLLAVDGLTARVATDLGETLATADEGHAVVASLVRRVCAVEGAPAPDIEPPSDTAALVAAAPDSLDLTGFGAVVVACGFRSRYAEWVQVPGVVDEHGFPVHVDGESVVAPGLHFVGVHFLRRRRSSLLFGVGDDATACAERVARPT